MNLAAETLKSVDDLSSQLPEVAFPVTYAILWCSDWGSRGLSVFLVVFDNRDLVKSY